MKNTKENQIKFLKNLYILKLFDFYIMERNKWNEFEETYKNNLLRLNLFVFLYFFFPSTFPLYFLSLAFFLNFCGNQT